MKNQNTYRIAILSLYSGRVNRGVETWADEISKQFRNHGNEVLILNSNTNSIFIFTLQSLPRLVKFKPNIVMPTNGGFQSLLIKILSLVFNWKVIITGHAGIGRDDKWNILIRPDVFVSPSIRGEKWAKSLDYSRGVKITHIPHGVDLDRFSPSIRKLKLNLERPIFLCVASKDEYKRVGLAKQAVAKLGNGSLLVLGGDKIVTQDKIPQYYASADVFTLPSDLHEAFGIAYLEALASNLPVVATNDSLRKEIVGNAGILVDPTNINDYAAALNKAANKDWGQLPRKQAEKFSWEMVAKQYEGLFKNIL